MNAKDMAAKVALTRQVLTDLERQYAKRVALSPIGTSEHDYASGVANGYRVALQTLDHFLPERRQP